MIEGIEEMANAVMLTDTFFAAKNEHVRSNRAVIQQLAHMGILRIITEDTNGGTVKYITRQVIDDFLALRWIMLPGNDRLITDFAKELAPIFQLKKVLFYRSSDKAVIEIDEYVDKKTSISFTGLKVVNANRLSMIIESSCVPFVQMKDKASKQMLSIKRSLGKEMSANLLQCDAFVKALPKLQNLFTSPMAFYSKDKKSIVVPACGYDDTFETYTPDNVPKIIPMTVDAAKMVIEETLSGFCWKDEKSDKVMAIAYLLTPYCRGLYTRFTCRTPVFLFIANRERSGKDYLAGLGGIIYEGKRIEEPPICTQDKFSNTSDELRKKLTSALKQGRRRLHFGNNRGDLHNATLEQFLTSEQWSDRELGKNETIVLANDIEVSLSANIGITYTPDFWHRCRPIRLFMSDEDPNKHTFPKPNLEQWVADNRQLVLSAIHCLVEDWVKAGSPRSTSLYNSFPEWAAVVGGIMRYHALGDPCEPVADDNGVGGDRETLSIKDVYTLCNAHCRLEGIHSLKISEICSLITDTDKIDQLKQQFPDEAIPDEAFAYLDFSQRKDKQYFIGVFKKHIGRIHNGIKAEMAVQSMKADRTTYVFNKIQ